jgi:hypothetical protein
MLRNFRERYLLTHSTGRAFVALYHKFSPPIARVIARHGALRPTVRVGLYPVAGRHYILLRFSHAGNMVLSLVILAVVAGTILAIGRKKGTIRAHGVICARPGR